MNATPNPKDSGTAPLTFGIYPGGSTGTESGLAVGPPDDPTHIQEALRALQGDVNQPFIVRGYEHFQDSPSVMTPNVLPSPMRVEQYIRDGRRLDLVVSFLSDSGDVEGYVAFLRERVRRYGALADTLQVTEEANFTGGPTIIDGAHPNVREALVKGVIAAKDEARRNGYDTLKVGFNAALNFDPNDDFWPSIAALGGDAFRDALGYVGLDFFPDVFRPVSPDGQPGDLGRSVASVLQHFRTVSLTAADIPSSVPIHITENGWPTGPDRSYERQARTLETVIRTINEHRAAFNVTRYEHFALRDADSSDPNLFYQFGLLRDDYTPKPAFEVYRTLIAELGGA